MISAIEVLRDSRRKKKRPHGRPCSYSAPAVIVSEVVNKRKQWTDEAMRSVIAAVKNGMRRNTLLILSYLAISFSVWVIQYL